YECAKVFDCPNNVSGPCPRNTSAVSKVPVCGVEGYRPLAGTENLRSVPAQRTTPTDVIPYHGREPKRGIQHLGSFESCNSPTCVPCLVRPRKREPPRNQALGSQASRFDVWIQGSDRKELSCLPEARDRAVHVAALR